jgi:hypothetical protein
MADNHAGVDKGGVLLLEINPDASWDMEPKEYRRCESTRVDFGGEYEKALHLMGGLPTAARMLHGERNVQVHLRYREGTTLGGCVPRSVRT